MPAKCFLSFTQGRSLGGGVVLGSPNQVSRGFVDVPAKYGKLHIKTGKADIAGFWINSEG